MKILAPQQGKKSNRIMYKFLCTIPSFKEPSGQNGQLAAVNFTFAA